MSKSQNRKRQKRIAVGFTLHEHAELIEKVTGAGKNAVEYLRCTGIERNVRSKPKPLTLRSSNALPRICGVSETKSISLHIRPTYSYSQIMKSFAKSSTNYLSRVM